MISMDQIAHDLAMAYVNNRYGVEVSGQFSVETWNDEVSGSGAVGTERLPDVNKVHMVRVGNGEKYFFGLRERTELVESGKGYEVDSVRGYDQRLLQRLHSIPCVVGAAIAKSCLMMRILGS